MSKLYPLKFEPILKEKIWGGEKLHKVLHKKSTKKNIGESWEVSDVEGDVSIVVNGDFKGKSLQDLIKIYKAELVGERVYSQFEDKFPLLIKFIDAKEALSIQLHPNDALAKERHNSFGKTEMWYVMQADKEGNLIVGFKKDSNKEEYLKHLEAKTLLGILNVDEVDEGDVYFISTGRVHAIGAGVLLAEIQQTSDITYRIYDWDRQSSDGTYRDLHTEQALDAIDYTAKEEYKTKYSKKLNKASNVIDCQYFTTNFLSINESISIDNSNKDSFIIYMCVKGEVSIVYAQGKVENINKGETILMPANFSKFEIKAIEYSELLEVYIK